MNNFVFVLKGMENSFFPLISVPPPLPREVKEFINENSRQNLFWEKSTISRFYNHHLIRYHPSHLTEKLQHVVLALSHI